MACAGQTQAAYCALHGLRATTFSGWLASERAASGRAGAATSDCAHAHGRGGKASCGGAVAADSVLGGLASAHGIHGIHGIDRIDRIDRIDCIEPISCSRTGSRPRHRADGGHALARGVLRNALAARARGFAASAR